VNKKPTHSKAKAVSKLSLLSVEESADFVGVPRSTILKLIKNGTLSISKQGARDDLKLNQKTLEKLRLKLIAQNTKLTFYKLKSFLKDNEDSIQKLATSEHTKLIGGNPVPNEHQSKYTKIHIKIVKAIALNLTDFVKGTKNFNHLGVEVANDALRDNLTIEEAVDGTIFLKQAILKKLEQTELFQTLSTRNLYTFSNTVGSYCDILASKIAFTYHNETTKKVSASESRFRALTEKSGEAIALVNKKGKVIYASSSTKEVTGYTTEEFIKLANPFKLVPLNERKLVTKLFQKLLKKPGNSQRIIYQIKHKGGYCIWVESVMSNLINNPNITAVVINYNDITERITAEDKLKKSEERFRALLNASSDIVYSMSPDWSEMLQLEGRNLLEETSHPIKDWLKKYVYEADMQLVKDTYKKAIGTKSVFELESRVRQIDGKIGWTSSRAIPILDANGDIVEWFGAASDVTTQKELDLQKNNFLGMVSHELKTPVTSIKAYGQVLETIFLRKGDTESAELIKKMDAQVNRLTNLIADLLDVTTINSGKLQFNEDYFNFNDLVREKVEEISRVSRLHHIIPKLEAQSDVYGDRERLGQVLTNFLTNAMKYSPQGNKIGVTTSSTKDTTLLCVQDYGVGIPKKNLEHVFEQFFRVNESKSETFPGLGLGLYISSEIIKREGGKIWVNSTIGKGSTFCFSLPTKKLPTKKIISA